MVDVQELKDKIARDGDTVFGLSTVDVDTLVEYYESEIKRLVGVLAGWEERRDADVAAASRELDLSGLEFRWIVRLEQIGVQMEKVLQQKERHEDGTTWRGRWVDVPTVMDEDSA